MEIKHLLFDLDNTLYPASSDMDNNIQRLMLECVADFFKVSVETALELKKKNIVRFSTTLEWLRSEGFTDIEGFLAHVHPENEADALCPQPELRQYLLSLDYPKSILTNAPYEHAERVLKKLGIFDLFDAISDIRDAQFYGKPYPQSYLSAIKKVGASVEETLFLDDMQKYTDGWNAIGGNAILVGNKNGSPLSADSKTKNGTAVIEGKTFRLNNIYELKNWLEKNR